MDTELIELSKKVYYLTKWEPSDRYIMSDNYFPKDPVTFVSSTGKTANTPAHYIEECPLYTSDYLLEKLPSGTDLFKRSDGYVVIGPGNDPSSNLSDTSLKALLKLTLALHKAGELQPASNGRELQ